MENRVPYTSRPNAFNRAATDGASYQLLSVVRRALIVVLRSLSGKREGIVDFDSASMVLALIAFSKSP
jgi:hypothetical protein